MGEKIAKIKSHISENKKVYITGAITLGAGVGIGSMVALTRVNNPNAEIVQKINQIVVGYKSNATIVQFIERSTPSKPVHLVGTDQYFASLSEAARKTGHAVDRISRNVNGHIPDVKGDVFELLQPAT